MKVSFQLIDAKFIGFLAILCAYVANILSSF